MRPDGVKPGPLALESDLILTALNSPAPLSGELSCMDRSCYFVTLSNTEFGSLQFQLKF